MAKSVNEIFDDLKKAPESGIPPEVYQRYKFLVNRAVEVFGDDFVANRWLTTPNEELHNESPLDFAYGNGFAPNIIELLDQILGRLEHGVFA